MRYTSQDIDSVGFNVSYQFFEEKLPSLGFSIRQPQIEYTNDILQMLRNRSKCLIIEAEVGTGKSFGYLAPLLYLQKVNRGRFSIVVSTGTIALQEQLLSDIELIKEYMGLSINVVLAKGGSHFLCKSRMDQTYKKQKNKPHWINNWPVESEYGDRAELEKLIPDINQVWGKVNVQKCTFRKCAFYYECKYMELREKMKKNESIIVTNHDQLIANAKLLKARRPPLFPVDTGIIIIDEVHNLEEKARNSLTENWRKGGIVRLLNTIEGFLSGSDNYKENKETKDILISTIDKIFDGFYLHCKKEREIGIKKGYDTQRFKIDLTQENAIKIHIESLKDFYVSAQMIDTNNEELEDAIYETEKLIKLLEDIIEQHDCVYWLEMRNEK